MAFWTLAENLKICTYCKIALSQLPQLNAKESYLYYTLALGDPLVTLTQGILTELDKLDTQSATYGVDKNALLIQADGLKWGLDNGGTIAMLNTRRQALVDRLVGMLELGNLAGSADVGNTGSSGGSAMVLRS
jgi:hypothetical protein